MNPPAAPVAQAPGRPGNLAVESVTPNGATVTWTAAAVPAGLAITRYEVQWRPASDADWSDAESDATAGETSYLLDGLEPGTEYLVRVRAAIDELVGDWSREVTVRTASDDPRGQDTGGTGDTNGARDTLPGPTGVSARPTSPTTARVTWDVPRTTARTVTGYNVRWRTGSADWRQQNGLAASLQSFDIDRLSAGTTYEVQVQAVAGTVTSEWSPAPVPVTTTVPTGKLPEVRIKYDGAFYLAQSSTDVVVFRVQATAPVASDLDVELTIIVAGAMVPVPNDDTVMLTIPAARALSNELRVDVDPDATATDDGLVWVGLNPDPAAYVAGSPISVSVFIDHLR